MAQQPRGYARSSNEDPAVEWALGISDVQANAIAERPYNQV